MQKKYRISIAAIAALMLGILAVNIVMGATPTLNAKNQSNAIAISAEQPVNKEKLKELIPATPEEAESSIYPVRRRFLMWTHDGAHIMWGIYGNGYFVGTDNLGKRCWGIYGRGIFAGFYDGEFFWGRYRNGMWKAEGLFGLEHSRGRYVLFPSPAATSNTPP